MIQILGEPGADHPTVSQGRGRIVHDRLLDEIDHARNVNELIGQLAQHSAPPAGDQGIPQAWNRLEAGLECEQIARRCNPLAYPPNKPLEVPNHGQTLAHPFANVCRLHERLNKVQTLVESRYVEERLTDPGPKEACAAGRPRAVQDPYQRTAFPAAPPMLDEF